MEAEFVEDVGQLVPCGDCFAVVQRVDLKKHAEWHGRANRDAVAAALMAVSGLPVDGSDAAPTAEADTHADEWPTHCATCGTELTAAVIDFDESNEDRAVLQPGEMVAVDFCPNPDCPTHQTGASPPG